MNRLFCLVSLVSIMIVCVFFTVSADGDIPCTPPEELLASAVPNCGYGLVFTQHFETITLSITYDPHGWINPNINWYHCYANGDVYSFDENLLSHTVNKADLREGGMIVSVRVIVQDPHEHGDPPIRYSTSDSYSWYITKKDIYSPELIYRGLDQNYFWPYPDYTNGTFQARFKMFNHEIYNNPGWCPPDAPYSIVNLVDDNTNSNTYNPLYENLCDDPFWVHSNSIRVTKLRYVGMGYYDTGYFALRDYQKVGDSYYITTNDQIVGPHDPYAAYILENVPTISTINAGGQPVTISPTNIFVIHGALYPNNTWLDGLRGNSYPSGYDIYTWVGNSITFKADFEEEPDFINWGINDELQPEQGSEFTISYHDDEMEITCFAAKAKGLVRYRYKRDWRLHSAGFALVPTEDYLAGGTTYALGNGAALDLKTGKMVISQTDLALPGRAGLDLQLTRLYKRDWALPGWTNGPWDNDHESILTEPMYGWMFDLPRVTPYYIYCDGRIYANNLESERRVWGITPDCFPLAEGCEKINGMYYYRQGGFRLKVDGDRVILTKADGTSYTFPCWESVDKTGGLSYGPLSLIADKTGSNRITFTYSDDRQTATIVDSVGREIVVTATRITVNGVQVVAYTSPGPPIISAVDPAVHSSAGEIQSEDPYAEVYTVTDAVGRIRRVTVGMNYIDVTSPTGNTIHAVYDTDYGIVTNAAVNDREITVDYQLQYDNTIGQITVHDGTESVSAGFVAGIIIYLDNGHRTYIYDYEHGVFDQPSSVTVAQGDASYTRTFTYDDDCRLTSTTGPDGTVNYTYHVIDQPDRYFVGIATQIHGPLRTTYSYNGLGQVVSVQTGSVPATTYEYDAYGNVAKITDPKGNATEIAYDGMYYALPAIVSAGDRNETTTYSYPFGWVGSKTTGPYTMSYTYDGIGRVLTATDRTGTAATTYNDAELWVETVDPEGNRSRTTHDQLGRTTLVESFTAGGVSLGATSYIYDPQHDERLWKILQNDQLVQETTVDEDVNTRTTRDADGNTGIEYYDLAGRLVKTESYLAVAEGETPAIQTTTYTYDPATGALASVTDPARTTAYHYNDRGLTDLVTYSDGKTEETVHDANGNPERVKDRSGRWTGYSYNRYNEVTEVKIGDELVAAYSYDNLGRVVTGGVGDVLYGYAYDDQGRLQHGTRTIKGRIYELWYEYDARDRVTGLTLKNAGDAVLTQFGYAYTPETTTVSALVGGGMKDFAAAAIGAGGMTANKTLGNGLAQSFGYDARQRLTDSTLTGAAGAIQSHAYTYGTAGNITGIDAQSFQNDKLGRLTSTAGGLADAAYEYDALGNRLRETMGGTVTDYVYQDGLLMQAGGTSCTYHPDGSLATKIAGADQWAYAYDNLGRMTSVRKNGASVGTYGYDQDGLRVLKEENDRTTIYVRDGLNVLYEEDFTTPVTVGATPQTRARVFLGGEIVGLVVDGIEAHYYVNDHLGTTELVTDEKGRLSENIAHTPFSERIHVTAYSYLEQRLTETDWLDLTATTARIENGQAGPSKAPMAVSELLHQDNTAVSVEDPHYTSAKEFIYHHDDPDVVELKVVTSFRDPGTAEYVDHIDLLDVTGKPIGDYRILLETRKDVGETAPTENLKFEVYVSKRLQPVESALQTKAIQLGDALAFSFTPQGTGLDDISWSISRDNGQIWAEIPTAILMPIAGSTEILLKAELKIVEGHDPPAVMGLDWVFVSERDKSERYAFTEKERDATGLYYFGARYYDAEIGRFASEDPARFGLNWYGYCKNNPIRCYDPNGLWGKELHDHDDNDPYEDTVSIAEKLGFSRQDARMIGYYDYDVDDPAHGRSVVTDLSWHFNTLNNMDSRRLHSMICLQNASRAMKRSDRETALAAIGRGLHAIQDISAHGTWDPDPENTNNPWVWLQNIHPKWYDWPQFDPDYSGELQEWSGAAKNAFGPGISRYRKFVNDTIQYLTIARAIIYGGIQ